MEKKIKTEDFGEVTVRNAMLEDPNGTDLHDGIEIKVENTLIEIFGHHDLDYLEEQEEENRVLSDLIQDSI